jgi:hypothetical protein
MQKLSFVGGHALFSRRGWTTTTVLASLLLTVLSVGARAQTYDCVKDFSINLNPNGVWSYGWTPTLGGTFSLYTVTDTTTVLGMQVWLESGTFGVDYPFVAQNDTTGTICFRTGCFPPTYLGMHPGYDGQYSVVRWTAPGPGTYGIKGRFVGLDYVGPTSTDVHVRLNSEFPLFDGSITNYGSPLPFFRQVKIRNSGDTIDFVVGFGTDGNYYYDSTGSSCTITQISAP